MNKYNMKKQIKETSFWKPEKISSTRVIRGNPLFDFPGSKQSNPRKQSNNKSNMFMTGFIPKTKYISPIYTKPTYTQPKRVPIPSHMGINPKPVNPINMNTNVPKKDMNWFQAKSRFPKLNPFRDADHDGVINMLDCKPFDKTRDMPIKYIRGVPVKELTEKQKKERLKEIRETKKAVRDLKKMGGSSEYTRKVLHIEKETGGELEEKLEPKIEPTKTPSPNIVKETNISVGDGQIQIQRTDQEIKTKQSRDKTQSGGFETNIKNTIKNLSENKDAAKLQELLVEEKNIGTRKVIEKQLKNLANIEIKKLDNERKIKEKEIESLTRKEEVSKRLEGTKTRAQIRAEENITREKNIKNRELRALTEEQKRLTRERDREYQRGYIAAKGNKIVKVKTPIYTSAKVFTDRYEKRQEKYYPKEISLPALTSGYMGTNRLKEIEEKLKENPKKYGYGYSLTKDNSWQPKQDKLGVNIIFDVPVFGPKITSVAIGEKVVKVKSRVTGKEYDYLGPIVRTEKYSKPQEMITGELIKSRKAAASKYEPVMTPEGKWKGKWKGTYKEKDENYPYRFDKYKNIIKKEEPYAVKILEDIEKEKQEAVKNYKKRIAEQELENKKQSVSLEPTTTQITRSQIKRARKEMLPIRLEEAKEKYPLTVTETMRGVKARKITKISEEEYNTPMNAHDYAEKDKTKKEIEMKEERNRKQEEKGIEMDNMREERERKKEDRQRKEEESAIEVAAMKEEKKIQKEQEKNIIESPKEKNEIDTQYEKETGLGEYSGAQNIIDEA